MEKNYVEENEKILVAWEQEYKNRGKDICFSPDGIMYRGEIVKSNDGKNWCREKSGKENELWAKCPLRILYLTKDQSAGENHDQSWDCRGGSLHHPKSKVEDYILNKATAFNENLAKSLYGLATTTPEKFVEYEDLNEKDVLKLSDEYPFAQINCKKEAGGSSCDMSVLKKAMEEYHTFLKQQILNLDADIFVCCGEQNRENPSLNFLNEIGYKFEYTNDKDAYDIYYDIEKNKIAIGSYHIGFVYDRSAMYDDIVKTYYYFLQKHPDFIKSHRK